MVSSAACCTVSPQWNLLCLLATLDVKRLLCTAVQMVQQGCLQVRSDGAGGPFLLYTTRQDVMYTLQFSRLAAYADALPPAEATANGGVFPRNRGVGAGKQDNHYTAMHAAMRCVTCFSGRR